MVGVAVCTAALIIVLSVFNGLEGLLRSVFGSFDPEILVVPAKGKSFEFDEGFLENVNAIEGVAIVTEVIEDYAYIKYRDYDMVVTMKGVSDNFLDQGRLVKGENIVNGELKLREGSINYAIIGRGVRYNLSAVAGNDLHALQVHYIKDARTGTLDPSKLYSRKNILIGSVFAIEKSYDENYIIVPLEFAKDLLDYGNKRTALEIKTLDSHRPDRVINALKNSLGEDFKVLSNEEQHADLYKILKLEKLFVFMTLTFLLAIGSINIFFSLIMLALDKKKDIALLYALGAEKTLVRNIFLTEGAIISLGGATGGLLIGAFVCWLQQNFGLVSMGMEAAIMDNYPVEMRFMDFFYTGLSIIVITLLISYRPAVIATRYHNISFLQ